MKADVFLLSPPDSYGEEYRGEARDRIYFPIVISVTELLIKGQLPNVKRRAAVDCKAAYLIRRVGAARSAWTSPRVTAFSPKRRITSSNARFRRPARDSSSSADSNRVSCIAFSRSN